MDWNEIRRWLEDHGHIHSNWDCIGVGDDSFYAEDKMENTYISLFTRASGELIAFVGRRRPRISVGGSTGKVVKSHEEVIYFLENHLENFYDELVKMEGR